MFLRFLVTVYYYSTADTKVDAIICCLVLNKMKKLRTGYGKKVVWSIMNVGEERLQ